MEPGAQAKYAPILDFARRIEAIRSIPELALATKDELKERFGYSGCSIAVFEDESLERARYWAIAGTSVTEAETRGIVFRPSDDKMVEELVRTQQVVVVPDARTDPRTDKKMVELFQCRTIIQIPLRLMEQPLGALAVGSFGDEGVRVPTPEAIDQLVQIGGCLSVALSRIEWLAQQAAREAERRKNERILARTQRLESIGILAGGVAHDFNNLLTVILANVALVQRGPLTDGQASSLRAVTDAAERAADLCGRMLSLGRKNELRVQVFDFGARIRALLELLQRIMPKVSVEVRVDDELPLVRGDGGQLDQVVMNLCINARDAMPDGGRLSLETTHLLVTEESRELHPWAIPGHYVLLSVTDDGPGIPPEIVEHIFEPFFTTKAEGRGSGLGLAVAYGIVRQHDGMLLCYSELGRGTTFRLYLPVAEPSAATERLERRSAAPVGRGESVLVAEDQEGVRALVVRQLETAGYVVTSVSNGEEAIDAVRSRPFDLVLLDLMMPVVGGREAAERIRELRPGTRFLFASGYAPESARAELLAQMHAELVAKPYHDDVLREAVRRAIDRA